MGDITNTTLTKENNMFQVYFNNYDLMGDFDSMKAAKAFMTERLEDCDWLNADSFSIYEVE